jgi:hypothetical protein
MENLVSQSAQAKATHYKSAGSGSTSPAAPAGQAPPRRGAALAGRRVSWPPRGGTLAGQPPRFVPAAFRARRDALAGRPHRRGGTLAGGRVVRSRVYPLMPASSRVAGTVSSPSLMR